MTGFRRRPAPADGEARASKALDRATAMLKDYQRNGLTVVAIEDVLNLLGTEPEPAPAPALTARLPGQDPLTGAMWAGPPGTSPPGV